VWGSEVIVQLGDKSPPFCLIRMRLKVCDFALGEGL